MLTLRHPQMVALARARTEDFKQRMVQFIATDYPWEYERLGEDGARRKVTEILRFGQEMEIQSQGPLAVLVQLTVMFGDRFVHAPDAEWANEVIAQIHVPDTLRMGQIRHRLMASTHGRPIHKIVVK